MELSDYVWRYEIAHDLEKTTVKQLQIAARLLTRFAGGELSVENLRGDLVNRWLHERREAGLSPDTVRGNRISILMLWKAAAEEGLAPPVEKVVRIKRRDRVVKAFTAEEINALLRAADNMLGVFRPCKVPRSIYWKSFLMTAYDSGLRLTDLLVIKRRDIWWPEQQGTATLFLIQTKTDQSHSVHLRAETMREIELCCAAGKPRDFIWPTISRRNWYIRFQRLCLAAGVEGTSKMIRRAGASYIARDFGEAAASRFLGHRTPELARKNYIDQRIATASLPLPPPLVG